SLERFYGILIENYAGDFPLWLAPIQLRLLPVSEAQREYGETIVATLKEAGYRVEIDSTEERLGKQIRKAELEKIPVVAIVGNKEVETQTLSIRTRQQGDIGTMTLTELKDSFAEVLVNKTKI
ncbi:MAG: His/Gly/Thr/Pro-type tRNA ligase C-terminal domain-containing protein, partial [Crocosphaera sp.]